MDSSNWRPAQPEPDREDAAGGGDWRSQFRPDSRQRIVGKIMQTLKQHLPCSGQDGLRELENIATRFEEKIYNASTSQSDYLRKISLKMLTMESKSQNPMLNALPPNSSASTSGAGDCQEVVYQKIKTMKDMMQILMDFTRDFQENSREVAAGGFSPSIAEDGKHRKT